MTIGKVTGSRFEISVDGKPRSRRDRRETAIEAAEYLKRRFPNCAVGVKDLQSGGRVAADYKLNLGRR
jgi:hypothetical protein